MPTDAAHHAPLQNLDPDELGGATPDQELRAAGRLASRYSLDPDEAAQRQSRPWFDDSLQVQHFAGARPKPAGVTRATPAEISRDLAERFGVYITGHAYRVAGGGRQGYEVTLDARLDIPMHASRIRHDHLVAIGSGPDGERAYWDAAQKLAFESHKVRAGNEAMIARDQIDF